jgi:hypothetical protein
MAKGNDGNLLQHAIEAELAVRLYDRGRRAGLHVVFTHGMGPYEAFERRGKNPSAFKKLDHWLAVARDVTREKDQPAVTGAYRLTEAGSRHYPNSGEILAALLGRSNLSGQICEADRAKCGTLERAWQGSRVTILPGSWRGHLGSLCCPSNLSVPWLFSMDPMTWVDGPFEDDDKLRASDLNALAPVLGSYGDSGHPGAVAIFCYSLRPKGQCSFRKGIRGALAAMPSTVPLAYFETVARGGNKHIGAVFCSDRDMLQQVSDAWDAVRCRPLGH